MQKTTNHNDLKICYFGMYKPNAPRDRVYLEGLREKGCTFTECVDNSSGLKKFFKLYEKHKKIAGTYDVLWVGYLSTLVLPLAWLISRKKIVFNALSSWYEASVIDREMYPKFSLKAVVVWCFDFLAFHLADAVLVESDEQKKYISRHYLVSGSKLFTVFTSADQSVFFSDQQVIKDRDFTVVFRGMFLPATGVEYVVEAAKILRNEDVKFKIIGWGEPIQTKIIKMIKDGGLSNVYINTVFLEPEELRRRMLSSHVMLGQFGIHERLDRTIQNKNFEALAMGMPFITRDSLSNRELLEDHKDCLLVDPANPNDLAEKILALKNNPQLREKLSFGALETFNKKCSKEVLADELFTILEKIRI